MLAALPLALGIAANSFMDSILLRYHARVAI